MVKDRTSKGGLQVVAILKAAEPSRSVAMAPSSFLRKLLANGEAKHVFGPQRGGKAVARLRMPPLVAIEAQTEDRARELLETLNEDSEVDEAYVAPPRYAMSRRNASQAAPPVVDRSWGLRTIGGESRRIDAGAVRVAVVDSGVDKDHPDLSEAIESYENFTNESDRDEQGHGTHVCGVIAGRGTLPHGIQGVSNARLLVFKGLGNTYNATQYYQALGAAVGRAPIVNLSLGGPGPDPGESAILRLAIDAGIIVVAAMGNEFDYGDPVSYPAAIEGVIAVGAVDHALKRAPFSNTGPHIDLVAPGVGIWSSIPNHDTSIFGKDRLHAASDGTSMATPYVTGAIALLLAGGATMNGEAARNALATRLCPGQTGFTNELGRGVLSLE